VSGEVKNGIISSGPAFHRIIVRVQPVPVQQRQSSGSEISEIGRGTLRLGIPSGPQNRFRLAQLDDYGGLKRTAYIWSPPAVLSLRARVGSAQVPGTWGFGFWNAPLSFSLGLGRASPLPALPEAAWFFHASAASHLSFRDDLPGTGFIAQTFRSGPLFTRRGLQALAGLPLLMVPTAARRLRRFISRRLIQESGSDLTGWDVTTEHAYRLDWLPGSVRLWIDGEMIHETEISPRPPLGLVIWIDNQFAAFTPEGRLRYGLHGSDIPHWLEISEAEINGRPLQSRRQRYNSKP